MAMGYTLHETENQILKLILFSKSRLNFFASITNPNGEIDYIPLLSLSHLQKTKI